MKTSDSYRKLLDRFSLLPLLEIYFAAYIIFFKNALRRLFVSIDLPAAGTFEIAGFVVDESPDVLRRIT